MERAEKIGLGVAVTGHIVLFGLLSLNLIWGDNKPKIGDPAVEITIAGEPGSSPELSDIPLPIASPEPAAAAEDMPDDSSPIDELLPSEPEEIKPSPAPQPESKPLPPDRSAELARQRAAEARKKREADARSKRESDAKRKRDADAKRKRDANAKAARDAAAAKRRADIANAVNAANNGPSTKSAGQVRGEVRSLIGDQIRPYMGGCKATGPDADKIKLFLTVGINKNGSLSNVTTRNRTGVSDLNRTQVKPLEDCIYGAIRSASPFKGLDPDYYSAWQSLPLTFQG